MWVGTKEGVCDGTLDGAVLGIDKTEGDTENGSEVPEMGYNDGAELKSADEAISTDDGKVDVEEIEVRGFELRTTSVHASPVVYPNLMNTPESLQSNGFNTTPRTMTTKLPFELTENTCVKEVMGSETSLLLDTVTKLTYVLPAARSSSEI